MKKISIVIIDSGINTFDNKLKYCVNDGISLELINNSVVINNDYQDLLGHGTNCADLIREINPNVVFFPIRITNKDGKSNHKLLYEALKYCLSLEIKIICLSLSVMTEGNYLELFSICKRLKNQGKIICTSVFVQGKDNKFNFFKGTSKANALFVGIISNIICETSMYEFKDLEGYLQENAITKLQAQKISMEKEMLIHHNKYFLDKIIVQKIQNIIKSLSGIIISQDILQNVPLMSSVTGLDYFNFYQFIVEIENEFHFKIDDYHKISITDIWNLKELVKFIEKYIYK